MDDKEWAKKIQNECHSGDEEVDHLIADDILCQILKERGFSETVKAFDAVYKWYA